MRYAIDRYAVGQETEVCASDFESLYFIPGRKNRFYCPECGEIVYFRNKGGNHPSQFYHQEKTERTPECDRRVDGRSELSLSQRVGLPLFLTGTLTGQFQLSIGFPALGTDMLDKASEAGYIVEISSGNQIRSIKVDQTNFFSNSITLVPIDFVPPNGKNYAITSYGGRSVFGLQRKWSDYADGFDKDGAVFTYEETGGRKIRRGDSISTNRSYFLVVKNSLPPYLQIHQEMIGRLEVGEDSFKILKIEITASVDDKGIFSSISTYFYRHFGVWLLECQPELGENAAAVAQCLAATIGGGSLSELFISGRNGFIENLENKLSTINDAGRPAVFLLHGVFDGYSISMFNELVNWSRCLGGDRFLLLSLEGIPVHMVPPGVWNHAIYIDGDEGLRDITGRTIHSVQLDMKFDRQINQDEYKEKKKELRRFTDLTQSKWNWAVKAKIKRCR